MPHHPAYARAHLRSRATLATLACTLSLAACFAVCWTESLAYGDLSSARLAGLVGVKGECCSPGLKTFCSASAPFACSAEGVACGTQQAVDNCGGPSCGDSENSNDACDDDYFSAYTVTIQTCCALPGISVECAGGGSHCMYTTDTASIAFVGCGQCSFCEVTSGPACQ
jgi:hypothetical protein